MRIDKSGVAGRAPIYIKEGDREAGIYSQTRNDAAVRAKPTYLDLFSLLYSILRPWLS
jgi:hypothetical protein